MRSVLLAAALSGSAWAQDATDTGRWLLAVGVHEGTEVQDRLRHAAHDAERLTEVLQDLGGVAPDRTVLLKDPTMAELRDQFVRMAERLARARQRGESPEIVVYYSGHSDDRGLTPWGGLLPWSELRDLVAALPADMRIVVLDSCASGAFVRDKGGTHIEGFLDDRSNAVEGDVFLTSASADESAQESDRLGGSYFTHHLVAGLRGAADADADRRVTLDEAYDYAYRQTVQVTELSWAGAQHPTYAIDVTGHGDVVLTDLATRSAVLLLDEGLVGDVSIRDTEGLLLAEVGKEAGHAVRVAVPRGRYTLRLRQSNGAYKTRVVAETDEPVLVTADMLSPISLEVTRLRGPAPDRWTRTHPLGFHLAPKLGSYGFADDIRTVGWNMNVLGAIHPEEIGSSFGSASWVRGDFDGFTTQGLFSWVGGRSRGVQLAGFTHARHLQGWHFGAVSHVDTDTDGAQLGALTLTKGRLRGVQWGGVNVVEGRSPEGSRGWQLSGIYGRVGGSFEGAQLGFINDADAIEGLQWGAFNHAGRLRGLQIGLVNIVTEDSSGGESLGVINAVKDGYHAVELASDALSPLSLRVKTGSRHLYSVFRFGWDPSAHSGAGWTMGGGIGGHVREGRFVFDGDLVVMLDERAFVTSFTEWPPGMFVELGASPGIQLSEGFAVFAGGGLGFGVTTDGSDALDVLGRDLFTPMAAIRDNRTAAIYGTYHAGIRVTF